MTFLSEYDRKLLIKLLWLCCFFAFAAFVYVIALQIAHPDAVYYPIAWWLPIRLDYFGEASFVCSFIFGVAAILLGSKSPKMVSKKVP